MINFVVPAFRKTSIRVFQELLSVLSSNNHYSLLVLIDNPKNLEVDDFDIPLSLQSRIRVVRYNGNIGLSPNLLNSLALADRDWLWICGDDDDYKDFPCNSIDRELQETKADIVKFSYKTLYAERAGYKNFTASEKTLNQLMSDSNFSEFDVGELIFTSNMLLRVSSFSHSLNAGYKWCGTLLAHLAVIFHSNIDKDVVIRFSPVVAVGNNRYGDISWGRLDLYNDLIALSGASVLSYRRQRLAIKKYCRSYITTTKLGVQIVPLLNRSSTYRQQLEVLTKIASLSISLGKFYMAFAAVGIAFMPLRLCGRIACGMLHTLSGFDSRFSRYAKIIEGKSDD